MVNWKRRAAGDVYIGERIREARIAGNMTQKQLADLIGISYQQLQKYESGYNRVNGARIELLVTALNRPLTYFFPNATDVRAAPSFSHFIATKEGAYIATAWPYVPIQGRKAIVELVKNVVELAQELAKVEKVNG